MISPDRSSIQIASGADLIHRWVNPDDACFIRVLAVAPDPMPTDEAIADVVEPPLAIDAEWMRLTTPGQPRDDSGLRAMQRLTDPVEARHSLVPLPAV